MANIELVIKINEEDYKKVLESNNRDYGWNDMCTCYEAVFKGTPLPKGHGDLIDSRELLRKKIRFEDFDGDTFNIIHEETIINAPTIIKADKEGME